MLTITTGPETVFEPQNLWNTQKGVSVTQQLNVVYSYYVQVNFRITHISQSYIFFTARQPLAGQSLVIFLTHLDKPHRHKPSGRAISPTQRHLPVTQHSKEINIRVPGGIRNRSSSKRVASDPRIRPRDHWDRPQSYINYAMYSTFNVGVNYFLCILPSFNRKTAV